MPAEAIQQGPEGTYVYLIDSAGLAVIRNVVVLTTRAGVAAVAQGLQAGDTVVTDGQLRLFPGAKTVIKQATRKSENLAKPTVTHQSTADPKSK